MVIGAVKYPPIRQFFAMALFLEAVTYWEFLIWVKERNTNGQEINSEDKSNYMSLEQDWSDEHSSPVRYLHK